MEFKCITQNHTRDDIMSYLPACVWTVNSVHQLDQPQEQLYQFSVVRIFSTDYLGCKIPASQSLIIVYKEPQRIYCAGSMYETQSELAYAFIGSTALISSINNIKQLTHCYVQVLAKLITLVVTSTISHILRICTVPMWMAFQDACVQLQALHMQRSTQSS